MSEDVHQRATHLISVERVEGLAPGERMWLEEHLEHCADCAAQAQATEEALRALRAISVPVRPALVTTTQFRVRMRARELQEQKARMRALWLACALSWVLGALTAPFLWQATEWVAERFALSMAVSVALFVLAWSVPAAVGAAVLVWWRSQYATKNGFSSRLI